MLGTLWGMYSGWGTHDCSPPSKIGPSSLVLSHALSLLELEVILSWDAQKFLWAVAADKVHRWAETDNHSSCWVSKSKIKRSLFPAVVAKLLLDATSAARLHFVQNLGLCCRFGWNSTHGRAKINSGEFIDQKSGCNILMWGWQRAGGNSCQRPGLDGHLHTAFWLLNWLNAGEIFQSEDTLQSSCAKWDAFSSWAKNASSLLVPVLAATNCS